MSFSFQISTLVQHRNDRPNNQSSLPSSGHQSSSSERTLRAIGRVGQAVNLAVERFVTVGETIADDNPEIKQDMYEACKEARAAGELYLTRLLTCKNILIKFYATILLLYRLLWC